MTMMHTRSRNGFSRQIWHGLPMALAALFTAAHLFADEPAQSPASPPAPATRVALVPSGKCSGASLDAMSVAEAQLAASTQIKLLDRQTIDKTLQEHEISLGGFVDTDLAIKTGKILTTDVLAVLEGSAGGDGKPQGIVVFDAKTGVRLCDETLASGTPDRWAGDIADAVEVAVEKYRAPPQAVVTLSIVGVRNVDMPAERDAFCEAVGRLLERELIRSSGIAILERQHLAQVLRERAISPEAPENALLASMQSIHLEITRYKQNGIGVTAILTDPKGAIQRITATDEKGSVPMLGKRLSANIVQILKAEPSRSQSDPKADAARMLAEAESNHQRAHYEQAVVCAEAALALCPEHSDIRWTTAFHFFTRAEYALESKTHGHYPAGVPPENVELATTCLLRCVELMTQQYAHEAAHRGITAYQTPFNYRWHEGMPLYMMLLSHAPGVRTDEERRLYQLLVDRYRHLMCAAYLPAWQDAWEKDFTLRSVRTYVMALHGTFFYLPASKDWTDAMIEHADRTMRFVDDCKPGLARGEDRAFSYVYLLMPLTTWPAKVPWELTSTDRRRLREMFDKMTRHRLPGINIFGMSGLLWVDQATNRLTPQQVHDRAHSILEFAKPKIADPGVSDADSERVACYEALLNVVNSAALAETERTRLIDDIFAFMLSRREAVEGVIEMAAFPQSATTLDTTTLNNYYRWRDGNMPMMLQFQKIERGKQNIPKAFQTVARLHSLIESGATRFLDGCDRETKKRSRNALDAYTRLDPRLILANTLSAAPWTRARKLIGTQNQPEFGVRDEFLSQPVVLGDNIYVVVILRQNGESTRNMRLLRISLTTGEVEQVSKLDPVQPSSDIGDNWEGTMRWTWPLRSPQVSCGNLYCATPLAGGIAVFPLDGSTPTRLSKETVKGMPTDVFDQMVVVNNRIFAMTSGETSYAHWYDPEGEGWKVIASSQRAKDITPVDFAPLMYTGGSVYDVYHDRILFSPNRFNNVYLHSGLYQFDLKTRKISKATTFRYWPDWMSLQSGDRLLCAFFGFLQRDCPEGGIYELNMKTDRWREICRLEGTTKDLVPDAEHAAHHICNSPGFMPPFAMIDGWLWSFDPLGRMSLDGSVMEKFPDVLENKSPPYPLTTDFNVLMYLPERRAILYGDKTSLWFLELPPQADPPPGAAPVQ